LTGNGDVLEPKDGIMSVGSGGHFALAAARALIDQDMDAETIAKKAMTIAADMCVYTNHNFLMESINEDGSPNENTSPDEKAEIKK
jgi:ATP-dependent HslUV protease, peptidase subunit HslV